MAEKRQLGLHKTQQTLRRAATTAMGLTPGQPTAPTRLAPLRRAILARDDVHLSPGPQHRQLLNRQRQLTVNKGVTTRHKTLTIFIVKKVCQKDRKQVNKIRGE